VCLAASGPNAAARWKKGSPPEVGQAFQPDVSLERLTYITGDPAGGALGTDADAKAAVQAAIGKLAEQPGFAWKTVVDEAHEQGPFGGGNGTTSGWTEKAGYTRVLLAPTQGGREFVTRNGRAAVLVDGNWLTLEQAAARAGGQPGPFGPVGFGARLVAEFKPPAAESEALLAKAANFSREGDTVTAGLDPEMVEELLTAGWPSGIGRRRSSARSPRTGGDPGAMAPQRDRQSGDANTPRGAAGVPPADSTRRDGPGRRPRGRGGNPFDAPIKDPKGSVTFQIPNGALTALTLNLSGSWEIFGREIKLDRTITTTITGLGTTRVDVPEDAREIVDALIAGRRPDLFVPEPGFRKLFDGRTLAGWQGQPEFWSVADRAIIGRTTKENPLQANTFLFARPGGKDLVVDDFELRLSYRITADNNQAFANSGIQYRSRDRGGFVAAGYQADIEAGPRFSGILYDEAGGAGGRGIMAERGEVVSWTSDGQKEVTGRLGTSQEIQAKIKQDDWNEYVVIARGSHLQHFINGVPSVDVFDEAESKRLASGILALQLHAGEPMTVRFKDIRIKSLTSAAEVAAANVRVAPGFKLDQIYSVPKQTQGSWVALCTDPKGRLIAADQNGKLYRMTLPALGRSASIEPKALGVNLAGAHGLLSAFDSLYVMVNERGTHGLYRARDTDGDDRYDEVKLLREIRGGGEHGMHSIALSPDGKSLYVVCGNSTELTDVARSRLPLTWGEDNLVPRIPTGFMDDSMAPQGWIARTDPDGKEWELIAAGMRNPFDIAFNRDGELFTYDADMEWDIGAPWYRPTRVNHIISGAEFGFRNGSGKWPSYSIDSFGAVVDIGPGSPTGITFGYGAKFPEKYREALFISDWSFGKLRAVHLRPDGASYTAEVEDFVSGQPLPVTDVVINPKDGAMYLAVGGRGAQSALYRVTYAGADVGSPSHPGATAQTARDLRRKLESYHGHHDPNAVEALWPYLADRDRAIRYAARIALEWQDPAQWQQKAFSEADPRKAIAALVALSRDSGRDEVHRKPTDPPPDVARRDRILTALEAIDWSRLSASDRVDLLRAYALLFIRLGRPDDEACRRLAARLAPLFPSRALEVDLLLAEILVYLQAPTAAGKIMAALREAPTQEAQIQYALVLRVLKAGWTPALREEYFRWFITTAAGYRGGNSFASSLRTIKSQAMETLSSDERAALRPILEAQPDRKSPRDLLAARKVVKEWALTELVPLVERGLGEGRDLERGRRLYAMVACAACHRFGREGGGVGPDLTAVAGRFGVRDLLEAIVDPSKVISDQYAAVSIATKDGRVITGRVGNVFGDTLSVIEDMFDPGRTTDVRRPDIDEMNPSKTSPMPAGLLNSLTADEIQDLAAFLLARNDSRSELTRP
jgi:putative heme-binding domain-containing protein